MSGERRRIIAVVFVALLACTFVTGVFAAKPEKGLQSYVDSQFDDAIELCKDGKDIMSRMVLALSYTEKYEIYKNKMDKDQAKIYTKLLEVDVGMKDADVLDKFIAVTGKPAGNKLALDLLKRAFKNAQSTPEDILVMVEFLDPAKGEDVNKAALAEVKKRLDPVRTYVEKGGTMPEKMQKLFANSALIQPIVGALAGKKTASYAKSCLAIIEEPSLAYLDQQEMTKEVSDAIVAVKKEMANRLKKFPNSTWYSAYGQ